ncbi:MAG: hypothetical protein IJK60_08290, partial [Clostridia bacterium]|nr:hypothetical protein [Clostridia bacterium]
DDDNSYVPDFNRHPEPVPEQSVQKKAGGVLGQIKSVLLMDIGKKKGDAKTKSKAESKFKNKTELKSIIKPEPKSKEEKAKEKEKNKAAKSMFVFEEKKRH